jgi:hypothetical protein
MTSMIPPPISTSVPKTLFEQKLTQTSFFRTNVNDSSIEQTHLGLTKLNYCEQSLAAEGYCSVVTSDLSFETQAAMNQSLNIPVQQIPSQPSVTPGVEPAVVMFGFFALACIAIVTLVMGRDVSLTLAGKKLSTKK